MKAPQLAAGTFLGGCSCPDRKRESEGCACGWGAFVDRLVELADVTDPDRFVRQTSTLATDLDQLLAARRPEAVRAVVALHDGNVDDAAETIGLSRQRVYKLMEGTGKNHPGKSGAKTRPA